MNVTHVVWSLCVCDLLLPLVSWHTTNKWRIEFLPRIHSTPADSTTICLALPFYLYIHFDDSWFIPRIICINAARTIDGLCDVCLRICNEIMPNALSIHQRAKNSNQRWRVGIAYWNRLGLMQEVIHFVSDLFTSFFFSLGILYLLLSLYKQISQICAIHSMFGGSQPQNTTPPPR